MRTIGISHKTRYWQEYCFGNPPAGYRYARMWDLPWHLARIDREVLANTKYFFPFRRADLFHTYNGIVVNDRPWVVEVESYLPRFQHMRENHPVYRWALRRLAGRHCKAVIFTSERTRRLSADRLAAAGVDPAKMQVVYRGVECYAPVPEDRPFTILFAGNGFFRKGGMELLRAFQQVPGKDVRLLLISRLEVDWGVFPTVEEVAWAQGAIAADPRITRLDALPQREVVEHMRRADVFVSTTFADPFNNTVLEAMATGLPIITSPVGALPEMVEDGDNGWLVPVEDRDSHRIAGEIAMRIGQLMGDRALRQAMGRASAARVERKFTLARRNEALVKIYDAALGGPAQ